jgi:tripartite-type tricarboxylate transporter receptor subunit TctC
MSYVPRALACLVLWLASTLALAQADYPSKPVRFVVPFAPGGTTDILARIMADHYTQAFKQTFLVDNRAGAGGNLGAAETAKAAPDGYTIMMGTPGTQAINQFLYSKMPYNTEKDFAPVLYVARVPNVLVVHPSLGVKTLKELIDRAKAKPGSINFATPGNGTTGHLSTELLKSMTKIDLVHVPYKGSGPALQDLLAGQVQMTIDNLPSAMSHIKSGKLVALGVTTARPVAALPDVPTIASVVPGYEASSWFVIVAPAGTPAPIIAKLNDQGNKILSKPEVKERFVQLGADPIGGSPQDLAKHLAAETIKWREVVKVSGAKID